MVPSASNEIYQVLQADEIRILKILKYSTEGTLECALRSVRLADAPAYDALSYFWGDTSEPRSVILVNGKFMVVTHNLNVALQHLNDFPTIAGQEREVWIDAICINQLDVQERNKQLLKMKDIYSSAAKVIAWIGVEEHQSDEAFSLMRTLANGSREARSRALETSEYDEAWYALLVCLARPYWFRTWIIQEILLCEEVEVHCGKNIIAFNTFREALMLRWRESTTKQDAKIAKMVEKFGIETETPGRTKLNQGRRNIYHLIYMRWRYHHGIGIPLIEAIHTTRSALASEPRDKIYGLLGLTSDGSDLVPLPNYTDSLDKVLLDVTTAMMNKYKNLDLVGMRSYDRKDNSEVPSWMPDWRKIWTMERPNLTGSLVWGFDGYDQVNSKLSGFCAAGDESKKIGTTLQFSDDKTILTTRGFMIDQVDGISGVILNHKNTRVNGDVDYNLIQCRSTTQFQKAADTTFEAIWQSIVPYSCMLKNMTLRPERDWFPKYGTLFRYLYSSDLLHHIMIEDEEVGNWFQLNGSFVIHTKSVKEWFGEPLNGPVQWNDEKLLREFVADVCEGLRTDRRLFVTVDGHIGSANPQAQPGDWICIMPGCDVPVILRAVGTKFRVIGDAYVDGLMHGEVLNAGSTFELVELSLV